MWYVYVLELRNKDIYVGSTNDLKRRLISREIGDVVSTRFADLAPQPPASIISAISE